MTLAVQLLGRPAISGTSDGYQIRSRKSWALLALLVLSERAPTRAQLAALLFEHADDPLGALRWSLAEVRRALGDAVRVGGDPVVLRLAPAARVDVVVLTQRSWVEAIALPSLGGQLLEGPTIRGAAAFESWLVSQQHRLGAATEEILHEAALGTLSGGDLEAAIGHAVRLVALTPLEENHHALLIRLYRMAGDVAAAERQLASCTELLDRDLGVSPGAIVRAAMRERRLDLGEPTDLPAVRAALESGQAAVAAGATETGADSLRTAVRLADRAADLELRISCRLVLAETLIHSVRGFDEEGVAALQAASDLALARNDRAAVAEARAELGYVDFLRGRYDRARRWLTQAVEFADQAPLVTAKAVTYLGSVASDQGRHGEAVEQLERGIALSRAAGDGRQAAYGLAMLGRVHLLVGRLDAAADHLDAAIDLTQAEHRLSFLPWPQALRGEVELARGEVAGAANRLEQAFARACRLGDPCWEGIAARGLGLVADARGESTSAFAILADGRRRANRMADPYVWLDGYILDAQCALGRRHGHPDTARWVDQLGALASRAGMRELRLRALRHGAALGRAGDEAAAELLAAELDAPEFASSINRGSVLPC